MQHCVACWDLILWNNTSMLKMTRSLCPNILVYNVVVKNPELQGISRLGVCTIPTSSLFADFSLVHNLFICGLKVSSVVLLLAKGSKNLLLCCNS